MKIKFSKSIVFTPVWRGNDLLPKGERFTIALEVLQFNDLMILLDAFKKKGEEADIGAITAVAISLLPKYAKVRNLHDDDGEVNIEQLVKYPSYLDLVVEILTKLSEISMPTKDDEKN